MGANFITIILDGDLTKKDVKEHFKDAQDRSLMEDGNSYSGEIGMANGLEFSSWDVFESYDEASDYLAITCKKRGPAIVVRYIAPDGKERWMIGAWCAS